MNSYESNKLKRKLVYQAWLNEKIMISRGEGTRDWFISQQDNILKYNLASGFVGQFLNQNGDDIKIQLVDMSMEFLPAHDIRTNNPPLGLIDVRNFSISTISNIKTVKLKDPMYFGYLETHRDMFAGQQVGQFGIKITGKNQNAGCAQRDQFGIIDSSEKDESLSDDNHRAKRMNKYGF